VIVFFVQCPELKKNDITGSAIQGNLVYPFMDMCLALWVFDFKPLTSPRDSATPANYYGLK